MSQDFSVRVTATVLFKSGVERTYQSEIAELNAVQLHQAKSDFESLKAVINEAYKNVGDTSLSLASTFIRVNDTSAITLEFDVL